MVLGNSWLKSHFLFLSSLSRTVIAYDLKPKQKASLLRAVKSVSKDYPDILAIGDGFNDVPMFKEAAVSIEITNDLSCPSVG